MRFIPPMLCDILRDPSRLDDARYVAEPKFDGQRAQVHVAGGRTVAAYSRRELDLLRHPGYGWLCEVPWPVSQAVLDGELCGATGSDGVQSVLEARGRRDGGTCFRGFDLLHVGGQDVLPARGATGGSDSKTSAKASTRGMSLSCPSRTMRLISGRSGSVSMAARALS